MHPVIYGRFNEICAARQAGGAVLELGVSPTQESLLFLPSLEGAREKVGVDLQGPFPLRGLIIRRENTHAMPELADASFDTVLCNSLLEHDPFFWKTLAEIRRVARPGALVVIGVPGYAKLKLDRRKDRWEWLPLVGGAVRRGLGWLTASTLTLQVHRHPGDFYRFSAEAVREVFFEGFRDVQLETLMVPPRIIGSGIR